MRPHLGFATLIVLDVERRAFIQATDTGIWSVLIFITEVLRMIAFSDAFVELSNRII